jgi:hypothetical protein
MFGNPSPLRHDRGQGALNARALGVPEARRRTGDGSSALQPPGGGPSVLLDGGPTPRHPPLAIFPAIYSAKGSDWSRNPQLLGPQFPSGVLPSPQPRISWDTSSPRVSPARGNSTGTLCSAPGRERAEPERRHGVGRSPRRGRRTSRNRERQRTSADNAARYDALRGSSNYRPMPPFVKRAKLTGGLCCISLWDIDLHCRQPVFRGLFSVASGTSVTLLALLTPPPTSWIAAPSRSARRPASILQIGRPCFLIGGAAPRGSSLRLRPSAGGLHDRICHWDAIVVRWMVWKSSKRK